MEIAAKHRHAKMSAQKARLVADQIRGLSAEKAALLLRFSTKKAAKLIKKVLDSAIANAEHNAGLDIDELRVAKVYVNDGPVQKRFTARGRGRADVRTKRSCHITVVVANEA